MKKNNKQKRIKQKRDIKKQNDMKKMERRFAILLEKWKEDAKKLFPNHENLRLEYVDKKILGGKYNEF